MVVLGHALKLASNPFRGDSKLLKFSLHHECYVNDLVSLNSNISWIIGGIVHVFMTCYLRYKKHENSKYLKAMPTNSSSWLRNQKDSHGCSVLNPLCPLK